MKYKITTLKLEQICSFFRLLLLIKLILNRRKLVLPNKMNSFESSKSNSMAIKKNYD